MLPTSFYSAPLDADVTIAGAITFNIWAYESSMSANITAQARLEKVDGATGAITLIHQTVRVSELGTSSAAQNWVETPAAGVLVKRGDRLRYRMFGDDGGGNMASGYYFYHFYDGPAGADGDSWFQLTENLTFVSEPAGTTVYPLNTPSQSNGYRFEVMNTAGLVGYWRLGESSGATAFSETQYGNADYIGAVTPTAGAIGDGTTGVVATPANCTVACRDTVNFEFGDVVTCEAWINRNNTAPGSFGGIMAKAGGAYYLRLNQTTGQIEFAKQGTVSIVGSTQNVPLTGWHHVVATKNGSTTKLYLDGVDVTGTVANQTLANNGAFLFFGSRNDSNFGGAEPFSGFLDEIAVYNVAITAATVAAHYAAASVSPTAVGTGIPREAWTFRGGPSAVLADQVNSVTGWAAPIQWTKTRGGTTVEWYTRPLTAFTLGGAVRVNARAGSNLAFAKAVRCEIARVDGDGTGATAWGVANGPELATSSETAYSFLVAGADLAITDGQRLRIRFYVDDAPNTAMISGDYSNLVFAGRTAAASGDTYLRFTQTLTQYIEVPSGPPEKFGTAALKGGGVAVVARTSARTRTQAMTGGGVAVLTSPKKAAASTIAMTGGGVITSTGVAAEPEVHTGTATLTGGGVLTAPGIKQAKRIQPMTGGGVLVAAWSKQAKRVQAMTGGGVITYARAKATQAAAAMSGGGIVTATRSSARTWTQALTGGGVLVATGVKSESVAKTGTALMSGGGVVTTTQRSTRAGVQTFTGGGRIVYGYAAAEHRAGFALMTGGGVVTATRVAARRVSASATGGGVIVAVPATAHRSSATLTGGGRVLYTYSFADVRSGFASLTGGGAVTVARVASHTASPVAATGGGVLTATSTAGRRALLTATGGGTIVAARTSARVYAITRFAGPPEEMHADTTPNLLNGTGDYTVGTAFTVNAAGLITHFRYWDNPGHSGGQTHILSLWDKSSEVKLATVTAPEVAGDAWHDVELPTPYPVASGDVLRLTMRTLSWGTYSGNPPASLAPHITAGDNGVYADGADLYPGIDQPGYHYPLDVIFVPEGGPGAMTGGGVVTYAYTVVEQDAKTGTASLTGGGVVAVQSAYQRRSAAALTGAGVIVAARVAARRAQMTATGSGVIVVARASTHSGSSTLTGGGIVLYAFSAGQSKSAFVQMTGGGVIATVQRTARFTVSVLTGGGVIVPVLRKAASRTVTATGGGVVVVTGSKVLPGLPFTPDSTTPQTTDWKMYSADGAGVGYAPRLFSNGVLVSSLPSGAQYGFSGSLGLSGRDATTTDTANADVAEVVLFNRKLSDVERQQVEAYLREKWFANGSGAGFTPTDLSGLTVWYDATQLGTTKGLTGGGKISYAFSAGVNRSGFVSLTGGGSVAVARTSARYARVGSAAPEEMHADSTPTTLTATGDYTVGMSFTALVNGMVTHIRYWHTSDHSAITHALSIWSNAGVKLTTFAYPHAGVTGAWVEAPLPTPLAVTAGSTYRVTVTTPTWAYYSTAYPASLAPSLTAGGPGVYAVGQDQFPALTQPANHYPIDVTFVPSGMGAMTGGGTITYVGVARIERSAFVSLTGGGVIVTTRRKEGIRTQTMTGGGTLVVTRSVNRRMLVTATGGGVVTTTGVALVTARGRSYVIVI